jgi:hypothetical protein
MRLDVRIDVLALERPPVPGAPWQLGHNIQARLVELLRANGGAAPLDPSAGLEELIALAVQGALDR